MKNANAGPAVSHPSSMHDRLRASTHSLHEDVERVMNVSKCLASLDSYAAFLQTLWQIHAGFEAYLRPHAHHFERLQIHSRARSELLLSDLRALGISLPDILPITIPADNAEAALGSLYVIEGSTLGNRVVGRLVSEQLKLTPDAGASFLNAYGEDTPAMWRKIVAELRLIPATGAEADEIEQGAIRAFSTFICAFSATGEDAVKI